MSIFLKFIGYAIGNIIAMVLPYGGVYLTGGIVRYNVEILRRNPALMDGVYSQPKHVAEIIGRIPIYIMEDNLAFKGAEHILRQYL